MKNKRIYDKADKLEFLKTYQKYNRVILHAEAAFKEKYPKFSRQSHYNWIRDHDWYKAIMDQIELDEIQEAMESNRFLRVGVPALDADGNFIGWRERPDYKAQEKYLISKGIYQDSKNQIQLSGELDTNVTFKNEIVIDQPTDNKNS